MVWFSFGWILLLVECRCSPVVEPVGVVDPAPHPLVCVPKPRVTQGYRDPPVTLLATLVGQGRLTVSLRSCTLASGDGGLVKVEIITM